MATIKLEEITTQYRSFVPDQVLTAEQLNTIIDYFEDQNRLTRVCLSGVGIVCGLDISYIANTSITVSKGCGVTTDGDLVKYEGKVYTHFKLFEDREAAYTKFQNIGNILELVTAEQSEEVEAASLNTLTGIANKVLVLYLENYAKEETPCTSIDCDTQGKEQVAKIRMLLLDKTDVETINDTDAVFSKHNNIENYLALPKVYVKRVILNQNNSKKYLNLLIDYFKSIKTAPSPISDLKTGISSLFTNFNRLLQVDKPAVKLKVISQGIDSIFDFSIKSVPIDIQYRYDILKDLEETYEEIKRLLFDIRVVCCPSETSFPKHLLLGELVPDEAFLICRHQFYPSRIIPNADARLKEIRNLMDRMYHMVQEYEFNFKELIKITPSKDYIFDLSDRSIPYYYQTSEELIKVWDHSKTLKYEHESNLGYNSQHLSSLSPIQNPLDYCLNKYNFYRIEGHLGRDYRNALQSINKIKVEKGLAFDVKVLSIGETLSDIDITEYNCHFDDLNTILLAFLKEQKCLFQDVARFFSGFSTKDPGNNKYYAVDDFGRNVRSESMEKAQPKKDLKIRNALSFLEEKVIFEANRDFEVVAAQPIMYQPIEIVEENLYKDEDVIGAVIMEAIIENPDREPDTLIRVVEDKIKDNAAINELDEETKEVTVRLPYELLTYARATARSIPTSISELNDTRLNRFTVTVRELCNLVERYQKRINTIFYRSQQGNYSRRGFESRIELLLNQLTVNCCASEKIQVLLDDIQKRKEEILAQKTLAKFVEKHPALEHKAGVQPGGTFVMVYKGKGDRELNVPEVSQGTVLADFALPYLCCSDCAPINFIIPAQKVSLRLPVAFICLDDSTQPILFEVIPEDGEVKADVPDRFEGGVKQNDDGKYVFDARDLSPELHGEEIKFTVNNQLTEAKITVFKKPVFDFEIDAIVYDYEKGIVQVTFGVTGDELPEGVSFEWDFGDDTPNNVTTEDTIVHTYRLASIEDNVVTVSLIASNGPCEPSITKDIEFEEQEININFESGNICLGSEPEIIGYSVTPIDADVETEVSGITILEGNRIEIDPAIFNDFDEALVFSVNGQTIEDEEAGSVIVWKKPQFGVLFEPDPIEIPEGVDSVEVTFTLENLNDFNEDPFDYRWIFNGIDEDDRGLSVTKTFIDLDSSDTNPVIHVELRLSGDGDPCGPDSVDEEIPITVIPRPEIRLEKDDFCINDNQRYVFIITPEGAEPTITGSGVTRRNGRFEFIPSNSNLGTISFTVDGEPSDYRASVHSIPETVIFYTGNQNEFFIGAQRNPEEHWVFDWIDLTVLNQDGSEVDSSLIEVNNNFVSLRGDNLNFNEAQVSLVVRRFVSDQATCENTFTENIVLREIPCATLQFGLVNIVHESLRNIINDDGINTENETLIAFMKAMLEEYRFFSDPENKDLYQSPFDNTFEHFDLFFDNNEPNWTDDTIVTDEDKQLFQGLLQYIFYLITNVTNCGDVDLERYSQRIREILENVGVDPQNDVNRFVRGSFVNETGDTVNISREVTVADVSRNITNNRINFNGFLNTINRIDGQ
ncbi:PKD domain-containing protein [Aquimarina sp. SS2-1]|uniref:PKD domain-containing protein n=1 Tax=Aquimarina besae TaxID=3342247 RepID=UPI00366F1A39